MCSFDLGFLIRRLPGEERCQRRGKRWEDLRTDGQAGFAANFLTCVVSAGLGILKSEFLSGIRIFNQLIANPNTA